MNRGRAHVVMGDDRAAIRDLERALELDPSGPKAVEIRAELEAARKRAH
jgi:hypothetical protein